MAAAGAPVSTISRVLNHSEGGVTKIYNRFSYSSVKHDAMTRWSRKLEAVIGVERNNVVAFAADAG